NHVQLRKPSSTSIPSIALLPMEPSQTHKRTHSKLNEDTDETRMMDLRSRFKKMHPLDLQSDESFNLFFEDAEEHLVSKYLHDLEQFFSRLPPNATRDLS
ncbi:hypothetical protein MJO28_014907, partial [Puccinia striiformis f. sp. tritici]